MFDTYLSSYKNYLLERDISKNTISAYITDIQKFFDWHKGQGEDDISKIIMQDLVDYRDYLIENNCSVNTVNRKIIAMNKFIDYLYNTDVLQRSIKAKIIKKNAPDEFKGLTEEDFKRLRREIHRNGTLRDILIFELLAHTGIRVSELVGLTLEDITIRDRESYISIIGKGNKSRKISLKPEVRNLIKEYLKKRPLTKEKYLFQSQRGSLTRTAVFRILKGYGKRKGIDVNPHSLRHTLARKLLESNEITTVQKILGHSCIETVRLYTQQTQEKADIAIQNVRY